MATHSDRRSAAAVSDEGSGPPAVLLHGFTQNSGCWGDFSRQLTAHHRCRLVDLPGHGQAGPAVGDCWEAARAVLDASGAGTYIGYSMGGRIALHAALLEPDRVQRLVLIGAHPGIEDLDARRAREAEDIETAAHLEDVGLARFLDEWLARPLFADLDPTTSQIESRLANRADRVAGALRLLGTGSQESLWDRLSELDQPTLLLAGAQDDKFERLAARTAVAIGSNAVARTVPGASHAVHLSRPGATAAMIGEWLGGLSR